MLGWRTFHRQLQTGMKQKAEIIIREHQEIFGKENYFIEIQCHPHVENDEYVRKSLIALAKNTTSQLWLPKILIIRAATTTKPTTPCSKSIPKVIVKKHLNLNFQMTIFLFEYGKSNGSF